MRKIKQKRGSATLYLVIALIVVLVIAGLIIRLNWRRFKAETSFAFTMAGIILAAVLILVLFIRHKIKKAKKEKEKEREEKEKAKAEAEKEQDK